MNIYFGCRLRSLSMNEVIVEGLYYYYIPQKGTKVQIQVAFHPSHHHNLSMQYNGYKWKKESPM